jgi:hypothetical protein
MKLFVMPYSDCEDPLPRKFVSLALRGGVKRHFALEEATGIVAGLVYYLHMDEVEKSKTCKRPAWIFQVWRGQGDPCNEHPTSQPDISLFTPQGPLYAEEYDEEMFLRGHHDKLKFRINHLPIGCKTCDTFWLSVDYKACDKEESDKIGLYLTGSDGCRCTPMQAPEKNKSVVPEVVR